MHAEFLKQKQQQPPDSTLTSMSLSLITKFDLTINTNLVSIVEVFIMDWAKVKEYFPTGVESVARCNRFKTFSE